MATTDERVARALRYSEEALRLHAFYRGKTQVLPKCAIRQLSDFALWYTPGVAAPCREIAQNPELAYRLTNKANSIAIVTDGTRVLGLGDIGPEAGLPVMEGKALLFKYLGGVDAVPICLGTKDPDEIVKTVKLLEPSFGGINLEDIAQPKCFRILDSLRGELRIPVWHDDQQGSATVLVAGLLNALSIVGKDLQRVRIAMIGMGAANVATYRLLKTCGVHPEQIIACDSKGILSQDRQDVELCRTEFADKWKVCCETNAESVRGGIAEALQGADVCIAFSRGGVIERSWITRMAGDAIVFACANPEPEVWPWEAKEAGARIVATGRSDFPNQVNNSLVFPGVFRGALDVRARTITDEMALVAAYELAAYAKARGIHDEDILPRMDEWEAYPHLAMATAMKAQEQGIARIRADAAQLKVSATALIKQGRDAASLLMKHGLIAHVPDAS